MTNATTTPKTTLRPIAPEAWETTARARARQQGEPDWALEQRRIAAAQAKALGLPSREHELWRRIDFRTLEQGLAALDPFHAGPAAATFGDLPAGLQAVLGAAIRSGGAFVWVPDGVEAALPIRLLHGLDAAGRLAAPRSVIVLGQQARATIVEEQSSAAADGLAFHLGGTEVFLGEESKLVFATLQEWGGNVYHYSNQRARIERGAELQWIQTVLGGRMVKTNSYFDLAGPGASAYVHGFMFGDERQHFHLHTLQRHLADHCTSDLLIKGCLKGRARSIYQGLIQVSEGAQRTDAYQANRNLLLSDTARADSIPGLEILANDVRCTHGATIGHVDPEQMYYLMARGLPPAEAQRLIVEGFFAPVLDRIPLEPVREQLRAVIERKIG